MSETIDVDTLLGEPEAAPASTAGAKAAAARKKVAKTAAPTRVSSGHGISWSQLDTIIDFTRRIDAAPEARRSLLMGIFSASTGSELAQSVTMVDRMNGYRIAADLARKVVTDSLSARDGMRLTGDFAAMDADELRYVVATVAALTDVQLRYRKDRNSFEVATEVVDALEDNVKGRDDIAVSLDWIDESLSVWPGV